MVLINGVKYACERCIRGHRVTTCNHTDQPLTMIKPKGRPSTTCSHCKELRKNKNANPSGQCTCGRQDKKRQAQKAKEEASCSCATDPDHCACHKKRSSRRKKPIDSNLSLDTDGKISKHNGFSYQSLHSLNSTQSLEQDISNLLASPVSMNTSFSTGWDAMSATSSNRSPPANVVENQNTIGLDPLTSMKPITPMTRTKVGEIYIPLNEYVPTDIISKDSNPNRINPLLMGEDLSVYDDQSTNIPNVTYFADTSKPLSYSQLKEQRKTLTEHNIESAKNRTFQRNQPQQAVRSPSFVSNISSHDSVVSNSNDFLSSLNSSDSLSSMMNGGNAHHYQDMLHHSNHGRSLYNPIQPDQSPNVYGLDNESVRSVEVLSITPSFMDIPESNPASIASNSSNPFISWKSVNSRRERSVSMHKNHHYDLENKRKRHPKNLANSGKPPVRSMILPTEPKSEPLLAAFSNINSPTDSINTLLSNTTQNGDPIIMNNSKPSTVPQPFLESSFTTDFNEALKQSNIVNQHLIDNNSLFSGTSEGNNPSPSDQFPVDFADIDDLMTNL